MNPSPIKKIFQGHFKKCKHLKTPLGRLHFLTQESPVRKGNQDACGYYSPNNEHMFLVLADGMGGHRGGAEASLLAVKTLIDQLELRAGELLIDASQVVMEAINIAGQNILDLKIGAGTTLCLAEINRNWARFYTIGDSMAFMCNATGAAKYKNVEHSLAGYGVEAGLLTLEKANEHVEGHLLLNALGSKPFRVEVSMTLPLVYRDQIILATDGLTANLDPQILEQTLSSGPFVDKLPALAAKARERMVGPEMAHFQNPDDLTALFFQFGLKKGEK
jgi:PPM family protein phosphatase